mgnify:CR=1 FL=1
MNYPRPSKVVALIFDDGTRRNVEELYRAAYSGSELTRMVLLMNDIRRLALEWGAYEMGGDPKLIIPMIDAFEQIEKDDKRAAFFERTLASKMEQAKEGDITRRRLEEAQARLRKAKTPEHRIREKAAKEAGVTRARADQILGPVKAKTKARR